MTRSKSIWPELVESFAKIKSELHEADGGFWPYYPPPRPAAERQIVAAEKRLGWLFPADFREFLKHANGWRAFFHQIDLLFCDDMGEGEQLEAYREMYVDRFSGETWRWLGLSPESLVLIGISHHGNDVFLIDKNRSTDNETTVVWLANQIVDTWTGFELFFRAILDLNQQEIARFTH